MGRADRAGRPPEDAVAAAFGAVPRRLFLPSGSQHLEGADRPVGIAAGQTNSQPRTVAAMLRLLDVRPGQRVLDVGAGSGWTTALLARLVGQDGEVVGVELEPELVRFAGANLARAAVAARVERAADGVLGLPDRAPWDRVLVSAAARELPTALVDQLAPDGVLVVPVAGTMTRVRRTPAGIEVTEHGAYRFVPLR